MYLKRKTLGNKAKEKGVMCQERTRESLPRIHQLWRIVALLDPQELLNLRHSQLKMCKTIGTYWCQRQVCNSGHIQEHSGCFMQTKSTGLVTEILKQKKKKTPWRTFCLKNQWCIPVMFRFWINSWGQPPSCLSNTEKCVCIRVWGTKQRNALCEQLPLLIKPTYLL